MNPQTLFDDYERTDDRRMHAGQSQFDFLNESAVPRFADQRKRIDDWYSRFPDPSGVLRTRFRKSDRNHESAAFELFLHELLTRMSLTVEVEPELASGTRPDFLVTSPSGRRSYIEATVTGANPFEHAPLERAIFEALEDLAREAQIGLSLAAHGTLSRAPRVRDFTGAASAWLESIDPEDLATVDPDDLPMKEISAKPQYGDWVLELRALPGEGVMTSFSSKGGNEIGKHLREAIGRKAQQHGKIGEPLVVAVNDIGAGGTTAETAALFGPARIGIPSGTSLPRAGPGVWLHGGPPPQNTRVSGVLVFRGAFSLYAPEQTRACLYLNPYAEDLVPEELRVFGYADATGGELRFHGGHSVGDVLGTP